MRRIFRESLRTFAIVAGMLLTFLWTAVSCLIDVFDFVGNPALREAAVMALRLAGVAVVGFLIAVGLLRNRWLRWSVALMLMCAHAAIAKDLLLYRHPWDDRTTLFAAFQVASVLAIVASAWTGGIDSATTHS